MNTSDLHIVLGATGGIGGAVVDELLRRQRRVRAVSRHGITSDRGGGIEVVTADVADADGALKACRGAAVVYHVAQPSYPKWSREVPVMSFAVSDAAATV